MAFDRTQGEPLLAVDEIQGDILVGLQKDFELIVGFNVVAAKLGPFKAFLRNRLTPLITTTRQALHQEAQVQAVKHGPFPRINIVSVNVGFSFKGLNALKVSGLGEIIDPSFKAGLAASSPSLGDPTDPNAEGAPNQWKVGGPANEVDGILLITGSTEDGVKQLQSQLELQAGDSWTVSYKELGKVRRPNRGHEHFGFLDGVSQPGIRGEIHQVFPPQKFLQPSQDPDEHPEQGLPGSDLLWPGEFVFSYPKQRNNPPKGTDPNSPAADTEAKGDPANGGAPWMANGSFMVFRRLKQLVPEFNTFVETTATELNMDADLLGARLVGRWKSGAPLIVTPLQDDRELAGDENERNDFELDNDPVGRKCPFAAHIRKAYPRNDITPGGINASEANAGDFELREKSEVDTQTHRILRRGIPFGDEVTTQEIEVDAGATPVTLVDRGLMFISYQTSITNQFEFLQRFWFNNPNFPPRGNQPGFDPLLGQLGNAPGVRGPRPFKGAVPTFPTGTRDEQPINLAQDFVVPTGGGYFFMPSISVLRGPLSA